VHSATSSTGRHAAGPKKRIRSEFANKRHDVGGHFAVWEQPSTSPEDGSRNFPIRGRAENAQGMNGFY